MNVGLARLVVILALVVGGVVVLATGFSGGAASLAGSGGVSGSPSASASTHPPATPTPSPQTTGVKIAVFNGTSTTGIAAQAQQTLEKAGYVSAQPPADSPIKPITKTIVYYRGGASTAQSRSNAVYLADKYFPGAKVSELASSFNSLAKGAELAIVLGSDYAKSVGG